MDNLKYYWLEKDFLEKEVRPAFFQRRHLTAFEFFSIIKWKAPGLGSVPIRNGLRKDGRSLERSVHDLTENIWREKSNIKKLEILLKQDGIQIAMASAILTILYPNDFSVYDWHVRFQLRNPRTGKRPYPDITYSARGISRYFDEYIPQVKQRGREISQHPELSLRDCDRILWAKDWRERLDRFLAGK